MKSSEISFFCQQLSEMLRSGVSLPTALRQLGGRARGRTLRGETTRLEAGLAAGENLADALERTALPLYVKRMLGIGVSGGDLPGMLRRIADYYRRRSELEMRFSGLLVYPLIVLFSLLVFVFVCTLYLFPQMQRFIEEMGDMPQQPPVGVPIDLWLLLAIGIAMFVSGLAAWAFPRFRCSLTWRIPPFKNRNIANLSSMLATAIRGGMPLKDALLLVAELDLPPVSSEMRRLEAELQKGASAGEVLAGCRLFSPVAVWMVQTSGRELASGLDSVAELHERQSAAQADIALYAFLPLATVILGVLVMRTYAYPLKYMLDFFKTWMMF